MKILHVTPSYEPAWHLGGVVRSVSQLCRGLAGLGHEVTVFTTDSGGDRRMAVPINEPVEVGGVTVYYFKTDFTPRFGFSTALTRGCQEKIKDFDIVHLTSFWCYPEIPAALTARRNHIPYVISPTGGLTRYSLAQKKLRKSLYLKILGNRSLSSAHAVHFKTELERHDSGAWKSMTPSFIVPNGFSLDQFQGLFDKDLAQREIGIQDNQKVVLFVGRLHPVKGLKILLEAFAETIRKSIGAILMIVGPDNGEKALLQDLAEQYHISQHVIFKGTLQGEKMQRVLKAADVLALVSFHENFGNAAVEAMLAGVPVLVSEHVGICREVGEDGAGRVVPLKVKAVAQALQQMLANPEKLQAMGQVAAVAARRRYDLIIVARQMATAYEDILLGRRSSGLSWSDA